MSQDWERAGGVTCSYCGRESFRGGQVGGVFVCGPCLAQLRQIRAELERSRSSRAREIRILRGNWGSVICDVDWRKGTAALMHLKRRDRPWRFEIEVTRRKNRGTSFRADDGRKLKQAGAFGRAAAELKGVRGTVVDPQTGKVLPRIAYELKQKLRGE